MARQTPGDRPHGPPGGLMAYRGGRVTGLMAYRGDRMTGLVAGTSLDHPLRY